MNTIKVAQLSFSRGLRPILTDIDLTLQVNGTGVDVTVLADDTDGTNEQNNSIHDLVADIQSAVNQALMTAGFQGDEIEVKLYDPNGNRIQFLAVEGEGVNTLAIFIDETNLNNGAFTELGFDPDQLVAALGQTPSIGTSSVRRVAQLTRLMPGATFLPIRGNLDTRLRKLDAGDYDALVLAAAGLRRLGFASRISATLPVAACVPAPRALSEVTS